jgi:acetyl esterase/lipase
MNDTRWGRRAFIRLCLLAAGFWSLSHTATSAMSDAASASAQAVTGPVPPVVTHVAAPSADLEAIKLSGRTVNPTPEVWEIREKEPVSPGVASFVGPELWVRNVSRANLSPFLPEPSRATGAAMIVAPGGAFVELAMDREGYSVAKWLNQRGIAAFVLKYRLKPTPLNPSKAATQTSKQVKQGGPPVRAGGGTVIDLIPEEERDAMNDAMLAASEDGREAVRYVRSHAAQWGLSPNRIGIIGFSAGAVTALNVALKGDAASRPDLVAPVYGALPNTTGIPSTAPPAFIAVAGDDGVVSYSLAIYNAWRAASVPAELHVFESGGHGFGMLHQGKSSDAWQEQFDHWLATHEFERSKTSAAGSQ